MYVQDWSLACQRYVKPGLAGAAAGKLDGFPLLFRAPAGTSGKTRKSLPIRSGSRQGFRSVLKRDNDMLDAFRYKELLRIA